MANKDQPRGAECWGEPLRLTRYVSSGTIRPGDFVMRVNDGTVTVATAASQLTGVAYSNGVSGSDVLVADDPSQKFIVQSDGTNPDAQTDIGLNYDITATASDSTYKISRHELDQSSGATTADLPLKLLEIVQAPDNALGANADCIVTINNHFLKGGTGTAGV